MEKKSKTFHEGARTERKALLSYLRRLARKYEGQPGVEIASEAVAWMQKRVERYRKLEGGL